MWRPRRSRAALAATCSPASESRYRLKSAGIRAWSKHPAGRKSRSMDHSVVPQWGCQWELIDAPCWAPCSLGRRGPRHVTPLSGCPHLQISKLHPRTRMMSLEADIAAPPTQRAGEPAYSDAIETYSNDVLLDFDLEGIPLAGWT
jgi:hypothetical protein